MIYWMGALSVFDAMIAIFFYIQSQAFYPKYWQGKVILFITIRI